MDSSQIHLSLLHIFRSRMDSHSYLRTVLLLQSLKEGSGLDIILVSSLIMKQSSYSLTQFGP